MIAQPTGLLDLPRMAVAKLSHKDLMYQIDLGDGHWLSYLQWAPNLDINPQYAHLAYLIRTQPVVGATIIHKCNTETGYHEGCIHFVTELTQAWVGAHKYHTWHVHSWEPLDLSPSLQSHCPCNDHGFIKQGRWQRA